MDTNMLQEAYLEVLIAHEFETFSSTSILSEGSFDDAINGLGVDFEELADFADEGQLCIVEAVGGGDGGGGVDDVASGDLVVAAHPAQFLLEAHVLDLDGLELGQQLVGSACGSEDRVESDLFGFGELAVRGRDLLDGSSGGVVVRWGDLAVHVEVVLQRVAQVLVVQSGRARLLQVAEFLAQHAAVGSC